MIPHNADVIPDHITEKFRYSPQRWSYNYFEANETCNGTMMQFDDDYDGDAYVNIARDLMYVTHSNIIPNF